MYKQVEFWGEEVYIHLDLLTKHHHLTFSFYTLTFLFDAPALAEVSYEMRSVLGKFKLAEG